MVLPTLVADEGNGAKGYSGADPEVAAGMAAQERSHARVLRGISPEESRALARRIVTDPSTARDTLAREELGIDPEELGGSAWQAAVTSFVLFAAGAVVPVAPFVFLSGASAIAVSALASAAALFAVGAGITLLTGRSVLFSGTRQLLIGLGAAGMT